jgi:hypothetical protein
MKKFLLYFLILPFLIFLNSCNRNEDLGTLKDNIFFNQ